MKPIQSTEHSRKLKENILALCNEKKINVQDLITKEGIELEVLLSTIK